VEVVVDSPVRLTLGSTYSPDLWDLRKRIAAARKDGRSITVVELHAPITSEVVEAALLSASLYLIGIRAQGGQWQEFAPDDDTANAPGAGPHRPRLPGSRWISVGALKALSTYRGLRLKWMAEAQQAEGRQLAYAGRPNDLLAFFSRWDGEINDNYTRLHACVLIFLVCEALRLRSVEDACSRWIRAGGSLAFTPEMIETVQNWHTRARAGNPDVWTWPPEMRDLLVD
jgi:hypothetical protein